MTKDILIIGGSSGLGLALAQKYAALGHRVVITGRTNPQQESVTFVPLTIDADLNSLPSKISNLLAQVPNVNTLIYAAGYFQEGHIDALSDDAIAQMVNVNILVPALLIRRLKVNPGQPLKVMLITSSSQYTPRELEPIYAATKSALGMLGASLGLDRGLGKVLVIAPSGMKTPFWNSEKDTSDYLDPTRVADEIITLSSGPFKYKYAKILRSPQRVEIIEVHD